MQIKQRPKHGPSHSPVNSMAFMEWTPALSVGVDEIDSQHKELFTRVNSLVDAMRQGGGHEHLPALIAYLEDYVETHFAAEEELMGQCLYGGYEQHRGEHKEFMRDLTALKAELLAEGPRGHLVVKVNNRVCLWLVSHIKRSDMALATYLRRQMLRLQPPKSEARPAVVYNHTVKGFLRHVLERRGLLNAKVAAELGRLGLDVTRPADMPIDAWWKVLEVSVRLIAGDRQEDEAWEMMGGEVVRGFAETLAGKSAFLVLRLLGPRRGLRRLTEQYRTADSVTTVESRELEPTSVELLYSVVGGMPRPTYVKGTLKVGMELVGARNIEVIWAPSIDPPAAWRYVVSWSPKQ